MSTQRPILWLILVATLRINELSYAQDGFWQLCDGPRVGSFGGLATKPSGELFAATDGVIIRSTDDGATWAQLFNVVCNNGRQTVISNIAFGQNGEVILGRWCGFNPHPPFEPSEGRILRSTNGGVNWSTTSLNIGDPIYSIVINDSGYIFAATQGFGGATVYRSTDSGNTWQQSDSGLANTQCAFATMLVNVNGDIIIGITIGGNAGIWLSSDNGSNWTRTNTTLAPRVFACTSEGHVFAGTDSGTYRSTDHGFTWSLVDGGKRISSLAVSNENIIFAARTDSGVYRSTNNGNTWTPLGLRTYQVNSISIDSLHHLYAGTTTFGLFHSVDNGSNWLQTHPGYLLTTVYTMTANTGDFLLAGGGGGLHRSSDRGNSWKNPGALTPVVRSLAIDTVGHLFAGTSGGGVFRSTDVGITWTQINNGISSNTPIWFLQVNSNGHVFAGGPLGSIFRSTNNGNDWVRVDGQVIQNLYALEMGPDNLLLAGTSLGVFHAIDIGGTWWVQGNDGIPSGTIVRCFLFPSDSLILAGTDGRGIYRSTDNGWTWLSSTTGLNHSNVSSLTANSLGHIFASCTDHGWIYRSTDQGNTWTQFHASTGWNLGVWATEIDSTGYLFASVGNGIYRSTQSTITSLEDFDNEVPSGFCLEQNYPNPFNSSTRIRFQIPTAGLVTLKVVDVLGREVATVLNERLGPGSYMSSFDGAGLASGLYFYQIHCNSFGQTKKLLLLK